VTTTLRVPVKASRGSAFDLCFGWVTPTLSDHWRRGAGSPLLRCAVLAGCQLLSTPPMILGEMDDTAIRLAQNSAPSAARLELTNVGKGACALVPMLSAQPADALPLADGRVAMTLSLTTPTQRRWKLMWTSTARPSSARGPAHRTGLGHQREPGRPNQPGYRPAGIPAKAERIVMRDGQGDYEACRYALLASDR
jgi:hypothetical protein